MMREVVQLLTQLVREMGAVSGMLRDIRDELRRTREATAAMCNHCRTESRWGPVPHTPGPSGRCTHCGDLCGAASGDEVGELHQRDAAGACVICGEEGLRP